jgi:AraC-like DNA-binding protein
MRPGEQRSTPRLSSLLDQTCAAMAVELLRASDVDPDDVAERVGYADARSFRRAFAQRVGSPPSALCRKLRHHPGQP